MSGRRLAALALVAIAPAGAAGVRELHVTSAGKATFAALTAGTSYRASLVEPTPVVIPGVGGWTGAQFATHQNGRIRYEWAAFLWQHQPGGDIAIIGGPAMSMSARAAVDARRRQWAKRGAPWPFGPTRSINIAGFHGFAFDGTNPGPTGFTLLGSNPPEDQAHPGQSFRLAALTVRGKTVVVVIHTPPGEPLVEFLPVAERLRASLRFPPA